MNKYYLALHQSWAESKEPTQLERIYLNNHEYSYNTRLKFLKCEKLIQLQNIRRVLKQY